MTLTFLNARSYNNKAFNANLHGRDVKFKDIEVDRTIRIMEAQQQNGNRN